MNESNGSNMVMPVSPYFGNGGGDGMFGGNGAWWIVLFLIFGGWGWGGRGGMNGGGTGSEIQRGFDQNAVMTGLNNLATAQCNGFAGVNQSISNGFAQAEIAANSRQMADMNQNFNLQSAFQNCCCENRQATADLKYTMANEAAATRANCNENNQRILDKLCQLEMDGIKQNYEGQLRAMQNQLAAAAAENQSLRFAASQGAQTSAIQAGQRALATEVEQYLNPTPVPAYVVQNPNCCQNFGYSTCGAA